MSAAFPDTQSGSHASMIELAVSTDAKTCLIILHVILIEHAVVLRERAR
jgi:hypothetical protein